VSRFLGKIGGSSPVMGRLKTEKDEKW